ncbi:MAG: Geranylgeranyl pyrophosphate synthase [Parcubacteria group bacterium GW2011_GWA2_47_10b]|nr:MAG: Geranylgeranyl pyrophosphate synthase [Parcubacteria group bacterium GW2011_GWA2_47_10b]
MLESELLFSVLEEFVLRGGKRIRPFFLFLGAGLAGSRYIPAGFWDFAIGIELVHAGMLVHDDIMDKAFLRRGKPAIHRMLGSAHAIVLGDIAWSMGFDFLSEAPVSVPRQAKDAAINEFVAASILVGEGQALDTEYLEKKRLSLAELYLMYYLKTATYSVEAPLVMGAHLAGAERLVPVYRAIGKKLGVLFQLQDDVMDIKEDKKSFLKKIKEDINLEKQKLYSAVSRDIDYSQLPPRTKILLREITDFFYARSA